MEVSVDEMDKFADNRTMLTKDDDGDMQSRKSDLYASALEVSIEENVEVRGPTQTEEESSNPSSPPRGLKDVIRDERYGIGYMYHVVMLRMLLSPKRERKRDYSPT